MDLDAIRLDTNHEEARVRYLTSPSPGAIEEIAEEIYVNRKGYWLTEHERRIVEMTLEAIRSMLNAAADPAALTLDELADLAFGPIKGA